MSEKKELPKVAPTEYSNSSRIIHRGPCIVKSVHMAADGANGDCQIYDGVSISDKRKAHLEALSGTSAEWRPGDGTDFDSGIYLVVNANTTKVSITYIPESWKDFI